MGWVRSNIRQRLALAASRPILDAPLKVRTPSDGQPHMLAEKITAALELVDAYMSFVLRHASRDIRCILVRPGYPARYWEYTKVVVIDDSLVQTRQASTIASIIVHEATHARYHARGIRWTRADATRIEHRCIGRQVGFVDRLPRSQFPNADQFISELREIAKDPWW